METYKIENLSFTYPERENKALDNINITLRAGEFVTVCGNSGCGKTTLLRLLKTSVSPHGNIEGTVYFDGKPLTDCPAREQSEKIGFVMQNPDAQTVTDKVWHELAFGLESIGCPTSEIRLRVAEMASFFGMQTWFHKNVNELSGGQKQLLNLASVTVMQPSVLILDEPTSRLDPIAAEEFLRILEKINRELGTTVILSEHRLENVFPASDRVIVMNSGKIEGDANPRQIGKILKAKASGMYKALPAAVRISETVDSPKNTPVTVCEGREWLENYAHCNKLKPELIPDNMHSKISEIAVEIKNVHFRYEKEMPDILNGLSLKAERGKLLAVTGGNGTGKTTLLSLIAGLRKPYRGKIFINGKDISEISDRYSGLLGVLPQNPQSIFVKSTVLSDLEDMLSEKNLTKEEIRKRAENVAETCRIENLLKSHPYDLSGGEQQRAALAKILLLNPQILLLDEPTKGMDAEFKSEFASILGKLKESGVTIIAVSHDIEFCAEYADRCAMLFDGNIVSEGAAREFFCGKSFYTTAANRIAGNVLPKAVLAEDIIRACGGEEVVSEKFSEQPKSCVENCETPPLNTEKMVHTIRTVQNKANNGKKCTLVPLLVLLLAVPLTVFAGIYLFDDRKYYFISLLIILESFFAFAAKFEKRKPPAREITVISVLCAIAVAGRAAFFMLPQFKPVAAIVILAGVCFGGETGFLVGAVTAFVSDFFFGQGSWTPWQMFAFGAVGFAAGTAFRKGIPGRTRVTLSIFGFAAVPIIYGGIMNPASVIMWQGKIVPEMLLSSYAVGLPFDVVHALSTAVFLWFLSEPMLEKLERIKVKYGFTEN